MCGILFAQGKKINKNNFSTALECMHHRGPDATGYHVDNERYFGQKRLKILDLSDESNQPFYDSTKTSCIIFNGEIYNYRELAIKHNIHLRTSSDTELLIELYLLKGEAMLNELNGMFAFIIYNTITHDIFAARDRLGVKPLFYYHENDLLIFSSEVSSILSLTDSAEPDEIAIRQYKKLRGFYNNRTIYKKISQFPSASFSKNGKISKYWDVDFSPKEPPTDEELKELVESSIRYRLISDVSVGSFLSGGLDSSIVATLAHKPDTWTIGFEDNNEFEYARIVSEKIHSKHREIPISNKEFLEIAKFMIQKRKEPLCVPNEVLIYKMSLAVKEFNTVILCGEGADELFFGYDRIFRWANENKWDLRGFDQFYSYGKHQDDEILEDVLSPYTSRYTNAIDIVASFFQTAHLQNLLKRLDHSSMLASIEGREPFVDYRLIERMSGVPFDYKMKNGIVKDPLKRIFSDILPDEVVNRKKVGFPVNLKNVFAEYMPESTQDANFDVWFDFNLKTLFNS
ncbi:asparagine synthase (glutamine-hydrolyzing) [Ferruginibacter sp. SUN002]|uniref:asparagine synthase (glutamine-hydrolyzing) n=1 Tax=Ferruginibacter sp. SUN002 TaxID=2937789 RepID=UPI003D36B7BA